MLFHEIIELLNTLSMDYDYDLGSAAQGGMLNSALIMDDTECYEIVLRPDEDDEDRGFELVYTCPDGETSVTRRGALRDLIDTLDETIAYVDDL